MNDLLKAHTLLVVPSDDLRGMLDEGPCGARPPLAYDVSGTGPGSGWRTDTWAKTVRFKRRGLVLRWEGQDRPHGWLAAAWATDVAVTLHSKGPSAGQAFLPGMHLRALREAGCTLIALDEQGKEVSDA